MEQQELNIHYDVDTAFGEQGQVTNTRRQVSKHKAVCFTKQITGLPNKICLINCCPEYTYFESVPDEVEHWLDRFGIDTHLTPGLYRLWNDEESYYAYGYTYEIINPQSGDEEEVFIVTYEEQKAAICATAPLITMALPHAQVRFEEQEAFQNRHSLVVYFLYPCDPLIVKQAQSVLERDFNYIYWIGTDQPQSGCCNSGKSR